MHIPPCVLPGHPSTPPSRRPVKDWNPANDAQAGNGGQRAFSNRATKKLDVRNQHFPTKHNGGLERWNILPANVSIDL